MHITHIDDFAGKNSNKLVLVRLYLVLRLCPTKKSVTPFFWAQQKGFAEKAVIPSNVIFINHVNDLLP